MVYTGIFFTEAELALFVGENVDATGFTEANKNSVAAMTEAYINVICKYNWSDAYAAANVDVKRLLSLCAVSLAATIFIQYNMAGYTSRIEAEDMININWAIHKRTLEQLKDQAAQTYMKGA